MLVPILKDTWGNDAEDSICYYSELEDKVAGTTSLGISNTETGTTTYMQVYFYDNTLVHYIPSVILCMKCIPLSVICSSMFITKIQCLCLIHYTYVT